MEYITNGLVSLLLIISALIAFIIGHPKSKKAKLTKNIACITFCVVLVSSVITFTIIFQSGFIDFLIATITTVLLFVVASVTFFVHRKSVRSKVINVTAFVLLLVGIVGISIFAILATWMKTAPLWG